MYTATVTRKICREDECGYILTADVNGKLVTEILVDKFNGDHLTLCHEVGHWCQAILGLEPDENAAETFGIAMLRRIPGIVRDIYADVVKAGHVLVGLPDGWLALYVEAVA